MTVMLSSRSEALGGPAVGIAMGLSAEVEMAIGPLTAKEMAAVGSGQVDISRISRLIPRGAPTLQSVAASALWQRRRCAKTEACRDGLSELLVDESCMGVGALILEMLGLQRGLAQLGCSCRGARAHVYGTMEPMDSALCQQRRSRYSAAQAWIIQEAAPLRPEPEATKPGVDKGSCLVPGSYQPCAIITTQAEALKAAAGRMLLLSALGLAQFPSRSVGI